MFDGTLKTKIIRDSAGVLWHSPLETDFVTTHRDSPHVTVQVNGYFGACLGACAFTYDDATTPMLTGVSGTAGEGLQHTLTLSGTAITATQLTCTVALWGGLHSVALSMQPAGSALLPSPIIYMVPVTVVALSITEGSTGGQYPLTVTGTGFPDSDGWEAGSAIMTLGGKKCVVISGGPTKVTCTVPAGEGTVDVVVDVGGTSGSLPSSFTYDVSLSPTIIGLSLHTLSLFGQEEQTGTSGSVHIGSELCYTTHWSNISVSCLTPALSAGTHTLVLSADGFGAAAREMEYVLQVTSASATQGSVKGGTLVRLGGTGFSSDCSRLKVKLGQVYECEVLQCSNEALTCITRPITTNYRIVNVGTSSETVSWYPRVLEVVEGDSVTWQWSKVSENSQLQYGVCEVASPVDKCEDADGSGFFSGTQTAAGAGQDGHPYLHLQ
ncbi:fibrocystin-L-like [Scylla paramamosain]|uniref:fibrocystin-L-like n=1 Tax=Scylla paramamosain TaxID=85552 RepID=UPI0030833801